MNNDILFQSENRIFSYRAAGLLIKDNKLLVQRSNDNKGYAIPGGHISFSETSDETIIREFKEETGIDIVVKSLNYVGEIFFPWKGNPCHQICVFYEVDLKNKDSVSTEDFSGIEHYKGQEIKLNFSWIPLDNLENYNLFPKEIKKFITDSPKCPKHFVSREI